MPSYHEFKADYDFDSRIIPSFAAADPRYFGFVLILRIALKELNPPKGKNWFLVHDSQDMKQRALRWNRAAWMHFKDEFLRVVLGTWDQAFVLIPPAAYDGFVWPEKGGTRRNLLCGLSLQLVDREERAHAVLPVVRLANPSANFGSESTMLASNDVDFSQHGDRNLGYKWQQHAVAHEVGHLLGLGHVASNSAACRADFLKCYGSNLSERVNIMGSGDQLSRENAKPWRDRIQRHTGIDADKWTVDWASSQAMLRGTESLEKLPNPSLIDI